MLNLKSIWRQTFAVVQHKNIEYQISHLYVNQKSCVSIEQRVLGGNATGVYR